MNAKQNPGNASAWYFNARAAFGSEITHNRLSAHRAIHENSTAPRCIGGASELDSHIRDLHLAEVRAAGDSSVHSSCDCWSFWHHAMCSHVLAALDKAGYLATDDGRSYIQAATASRPRQRTGRKTKRAPAAVKQSERTPTKQNWS